MKNCLILISILFLSFQSYSQGLRVNSELPVNIDANGSSPNQSAMLDVKSTSKGVLVPRMTTSQRNNINSPAKGLLVFDTSTNTFWFYNGSTWKDIGLDTTLTESQVDNYVINNGYLTNEIDGDPFNELELPVNPQAGVMVYYNGSNWLTVAPGITGQKLCYCNGVPTWGPCPGSCSDGIQNQGEEDIDCGGPCPDCPCDCPAPEIIDLVCESGDHPFWRFQVIGIQPSDLITWSDDLGFIEVFQGQNTYMILNPPPGTAGSSQFTVYCEVSRLCSGTWTSRTAYYTNSFGYQCGTGLTGYSSFENCSP